MRRVSFAMMGLLLATAAWAGPKVPRSAMSDVPQAVLDQGAALAAKVETLDTAIAEAEREAAHEKGANKTMRLEVKAKEAEIDAEKAKRKAAKKAKDRERQALHEANIEALEARLAQMEDELNRADAYVGLIEARVGVMKAEKEIAEAEIQLKYAESVLETHPEIDINRFESTATRAEIAFQQARASAAEAEVKFVSKGGSLDAAQKVSTGGTSAEGNAPIAMPPPDVQAAPEPVKKEPAPEPPPE